MHAAAVNPYDWHHLTGTPYLMRSSSGLRRPKTRVPEVGAISPVIDRSYPLADLPEALAYVGAGHARAKVVVTL